MPSPFTVEFSVALERWGERQAAAGRRRETGRTSIRVSKSTLAALRAFATRLKAAAVADGGLTDWQVVEPSPDAILEAVAAGVVRLGHGAKPKKPAGRKRHASSDRKRHASKRSTKGMPSSSS